MDADCVSTLLESRPDWPVTAESIFDVPTQELLDRAGSKKGDDRSRGWRTALPAVLEGWLLGSRGRPPPERPEVRHARGVSARCPRGPSKVLLLENVEGLKYAGKDEGLQLLLSELDGHQQTPRGHRTSPTSNVLNAADFGVPQLRERVFIVAHRRRSAVHVSRTTHSSATPKNRLACSTRRGNRTELRGMRWPTLRSLPMRISPFAASGRIFFRRFPKDPTTCTTPTAATECRSSDGDDATGRFCSSSRRTAPHGRSRRSQVRRSDRSTGRIDASASASFCRLQTFPDDVNIVGGRGSAQKQLGNAVPSLLAEVMGRAIREQLLDCPNRKASLKLLPPRRTPIPPPEPVAKVPRRFRQLVGEHSPHPGTGLGHGATSRREQLA